MDCVLDHVCIRVITDVLYPTIRSNTTLGRVPFWIPSQQGKNKHGWPGPHCTTHSLHPADSQKLSHITAASLMAQPDSSHTYGTQGRIKTWEPQGTVCLCEHVCTCYLFIAQHPSFHPLLPWDLYHPLSPCTFSFQICLSLLLNICHSLSSRNLFSRKPKEPKPPSQNAPGWRLFGKVPLRENTTKDPKDSFTIQQVSITLYRTQPQPVRLNHNLFEFYP